MSTVEVSVIVNEKCRNTLARLGALDKTPEMDAAKRLIAVAALQHEKQEFLDRSDPKRSPWRPLGFTTVVMRPKGSGPKIYGEEDVAAKRGQIDLLRDHNRLFNSLVPQASGNVLDILPGAVRVGTNVEYAERQQNGGTSVFKFGPEEEKRFEKNVSRVKKGFKRPPKRKDGKRHVWAKLGLESPWNSFFFRVRAAFRKMAGKSFRVPARPFLIAPKPEWMVKYTQIASNAVKRITG